MPFVVETFSFKLMEYLKFLKHITYLYYRIGHNMIDGLLPEEEYKTGELSLSRLKLPDWKYKPAGNELSGNMYTTTLALSSRDQMGVFY